MKLTVGVLAGLLFVSTIAMGQSGGSQFPQAANPALRNGGSVTVAWAHDDLYNRVLESQVDQYKTENSTIGQAPTALAGNNMRTDGQQLAEDTFSQSSGNDFYNRVLAAKVGEYIADNNAVAPLATDFAELQPMDEAPASIAANAGARGERDWYDTVVATQAELNRRIKRSEVPNTF